MRQIKILTKLELANLFSLNVIRYTKDKKARNTGIALGCTIGFLILMAIAYVSGMSYGFIKLGAGNIVPAYIVFLSSILTLLFCAFKAGKIIFKENCYDILASMPIKTASLVISRYIRLYIEGLMVACIVMIPGVILYGAFERPGVLAIILGLLSMIIVPIIPITLSVLLGLIITGISSRMKNKVLFETVFVVGIVIAIFLLSAFVPTEDMENFDMQAIKEVASKLIDMLHKIYPPTTWFSKAIGAGDVVGFIIGVILSLVSFLAVIFLTTVNFEIINRGIHTNSAKHNYKLGELENKTMMKALVSREAKRYFSSGTYVTNTIIGPVMAVIFAASLFFVDMNDALKGLPINIDINAAIPVLFSGILVMNSPIATAISMEGKEFWISKTLPILSRDILKSKLIFNAMLIVPFYVVGEVIMIIALRPSITKVLWMVVLPAIVIVCALVVGIAANLKFPKLNWDSDVEVVKQSASALIGGMAGFLIALIATIPLMLVPVRYYNLVACVEFIVLVIVALVVNEKNYRFDMKKI